MNFDINRMKRSDQVIAVCGALLFLSFFLPFFGVSGIYPSRSGHASGLFAWAGLWFGLLAGGLGFFPTLGIPWPGQIPVTKTVATLGASALATLLLVLKLLIGYDVGNSLVSIHLDRKFGLYFAVIVAIVEVIFAALAFKESGEALPTKADFQGFGGGGSAPGHPSAQGYGQPPAAGYAPPPPPPPAGGFAPPPAFGTQPPPPPFGTQPPPADPPASWQPPPSP